MSKTIRYVECGHCGETVGTYYVTLPLLRIPPGVRSAGGHGWLGMVTLDPPPDLLEIAEALDAMAKPHVGSGWANTNYTDLPCTTPRQEAIWMEYNGITRGED